MTTLTNRIHELLTKLDADGWLPIEEAPRDGNPIRVKYQNQPENYAIWNPYYEKWCVAYVQVGMMDGEWDDIYFDQELEKDGVGVTHFKPLDDDTNKQAAELLRECLAYSEKLERKLSMAMEMMDEMEKHND